MQISRALALALLSLNTLACETFIVFVDETVTFDQNSLFIGASGNDEVSPQPAINVGGQLTVAGAIVLGGAYAGEGRFGVGGSAPGIQVNGNLIVTAGTIQGGPVSVPAGTSITGLSGDGVQAWRATVTIAGGQLRGGPAPIGVIPGAGVDGLMSTVTVRGGVIDMARVVQSRFIMTGGEIGRISIDPITISQTEVFPDGTEETRTATLGSCGEIRGGTLRGSIGVVQSDLFVVGSRFNLPFGQIQTTPVRLTGELADGTPVDTMIFTPGRTVLLQTPAPGSPQSVPGSLCPLSVLDVPDLFPEIKRPPPPPFDPTLP